MILLFRLLKRVRNKSFLGWILPGINKFSASRTFFSWLNPTKKFNVNSNMNGEERAYVVSGVYEKVLPNGYLSSTTH